MGNANAEGLVAGLEPFSDSVGLGTAAGMAVLLGTEDELEGRRTGPGEAFEGKTNDCSEVDGMDWDWNRVFAVAMLGIWD